MWYLSSSNVKFHDIDTKAPMLTWAICKEEPKDAFYMVETDKLTAEERQYVDEVPSRKILLLLMHR